MKWPDLTDLNIWENFKNFFKSITKDYTRFSFVSFFYAILLFALYPFLSNVEKTLKSYTWVLGFAIIILLILTIYFCSQLKYNIELYKWVTPTLVSIETVLIIGFIMFLVYNDGFNTGPQGLWSAINIVIVTGFTIVFMWKFISCYISSLNNVECDNATIVETWVITTCVISFFILLSGILITFKKLRNWTYNETVDIKQVMMYLILILFVLMIVLNGPTTGNVFNTPQSSTPNTILQSLIKFICIIVIIICTQIFYNYSTTPGTIFAITIILINVLPFIFNIKEEWMQTIIFYPVFGILFFGIIFILVGWNNFWGAISSLSNFLSLFWQELVNFANQLRNPQQNAPNTPSNFTNGIIFHTILFVFVFGFSVFLLFIGKTALAAKIKGSGDDFLKNLGYLKSWWLWVGFVLVYIIIFVISWYVSSINTAEFSDNSKIVSFISILSLTIVYFIVLYYNFFNFNGQLVEKKDDNASIYAKNISVVLIVAVLLFSLSKYGKVNNSFIIIFILLSILFIYNKVEKFLYSELWKSATHTNCSISKSGSIATAFVFLFFSLILAFYLSPVTNLLYVFVACLMAILGYYLGEIMTASSEKKDNYFKSNYCNEFKSTPGLTSNESLKIVFYISIIILFFIAMTFFTQKISNPENSLFALIVMGLFIFLFWSYLLLTGEGLTNAVSIFSLITTKGYFTSNLINRWCDFLIVFTTFIIFMSGIGLIITVSSSEILSQGVKNFNEFFTKYGISSKIFDDFSKMKLGDIMQIVNAPIKKTVFLFLFLFYKIFSLFIIIPLKLNVIYSKIGNFVERNFLMGVIIILIVEFIIVCVYLLGKTIYQFIESTFFDENKHRFVLIKKPTYIFPAKQQIYEALPKDQPYIFGLSFSLFIEEPGSSNEFISILSYNGNPCIMYKPSANNLIVTIPKGYANISDPVKVDNQILIDSYTILNSHIGSELDGNYIVYSTTEVKLQTWINLFINYNNGVIDIFFNGQLANSSNLNQLEAQYSNTITLGYENEDTHIKINNLDFYNKNIGSDNILRINLKNHYTE